MKVSLTFDNGPDPDVTPQVLDTLGRHGVKATFFLLGRNLAEPERRAIAVRAFNEGHRLGNHSYTHSVPFGLMEHPADAVKEILSTDELLGDLRGPERLFRPFGRAKLGPHLLTQPAWDVLVAHRYTCVLWTYVPPERDQPESWMEPTVRSCEERLWSVIVMHDLPTGAMKQLHKFLQMLSDRGAEFSQEFPQQCTPLRRGIPVGDYRSLMPGLTRQAP